MADRHWFGDIAFAVLLVMPIVGLARWQPVNHHITTPAAISMTAGDHSPDGRISILG